MAAYCLLTPSLRLHPFQPPAALQCRREGAGGAPSGANPHALRLVRLRAYALTLMSGSRTRPRLVRQLRLDGSVGLIEIHGTGARTRANITVDKTLFAATRALALDCRFSDSEPIGLTLSRSTRPRPRAPTKRGRAS